MRVTFQTVINVINGTTISAKGTVVHWYESQNEDYLACLVVSDEDQKFYRVNIRDLKALK